MSTNVLTVEEANELRTQGTSLKALRGRDLANGIYEVSELKFSFEGRDDIKEKLTNMGKDATWCDNLPAKNVNGTVVLIQGDAKKVVYLNNSLFNLLESQQVVTSKTKGKSVEYNVNLNKQLKIS